MNELKVVAEQHVGEIKWNYDELKAALKEQMEVYKNTEYTDDTIKNAKADRSTLNKLAKAIDDKRKELKNQFMVPYDTFEQQAKELIAIIKEPVSLIDTKVKEYENRVKKQKHDEIMAYWNEKSASLDEEIKEIAFRKIYDDRWTNATATKKAYKDGIDSGIENIIKDIDAIKAMQSKYEADGMAEYKKNLCMADAVAVMNQRQKQEEEILRREKERLQREAEDEARRKAEEERQRIREEEAAKVKESLEKRKCVSKPVDNVGKPVDKNADTIAEEKAPEPVETKPEPEKQEASCYLIKIPHDKEALDKVTGYLDFSEIEYEVMEK